MSDAETLAEIMRTGDSIPPDELTDEALTWLTETLARYARKYLPEGFVLRLDCSAYAHEITLLKVADVKAGGGILEMTQVNAAEDHWGKACDYAMQEG
jgi:hypothetical protein